MKIKTITVFIALLFSGSLAAQTPAAPAVASQAAVQTELPFEAQVAASEKLLKGDTQPTWLHTEQADNPAVAYADAFAQWEKQQTEAITPEIVRISQQANNATPATRASNSGSLVTNVGWAAAMQGSFSVPAGGPADHGLTALAGLFTMIDILSASGANNEKRRAQQEWIKTEEAKREQRLLTLRTPSLTFVRKAPGATSEEALYAEIKAGTRFVTSLGLQCEPTLLHGDPAFMGTHFFSSHSYTRNFVCGYAPDEKLTVSEGLDEARVLAVTVLKDGDTVVRYTMPNMAKMARIHQLLPGVPDNELARAAYQRVKAQVPAEWTAVYTAPNKNGELTVYAARGDAVLEFPPIPKQ